LMLRDGGDDRDVDLGVARVPEWVESAAPWCNDSCKKRFQISSSSLNNRFGALQRQ
jgi:hypothetical protein